MRAIAIVPGVPGARLVDRPEPEIAEPDQVKVRVLSVGVCGTDREEAAGGRARAPAGCRELVLGHEMLGRVVATGPAVTHVRTGERVVFTVRRGCRRCRPCALGRADLCRTGQYGERGIRGLDGYHAEYVVDRAEFAVRVPDELGPTAVLAEPLSVVEKALDEAVRVQRARLPDGEAWDLAGRPCLVAGLGPVGLLAAMALALRGARVWGLDVLDAGSARPAWLAAIGGHYIDAREAGAGGVSGIAAAVDVVVEAAGDAGLALGLLETLAPGGIAVLTGIPGEGRPAVLPGGTLVRELVLGNRIVAGSVNAAPEHFQTAVEDLARGRLRWGDGVARLITHRYPVAGFEAALGRPGPDEIKAVVEWAS